MKEKHKCSKMIADENRKFVGQDMEIYGEYKGQSQLTFWRVRLSFIEDRLKLCKFDLLNSYIIKIESNVKFR